MSMLLSLIPIDWLLGALGMIGIGIAAYFKGRNSGVDTEKAKQAASEIRARDIADEIDDAVAGRDPSSNRERMKSWKR